MAVLAGLVNSLTADNVALRAEIAKRDAVPEKPIKWVALKQAERGSFGYEAVRTWCVAGVIVAEKRGGRWFVSDASLREHVASLQPAWGMDGASTTTERHGG